jgi:pyruvate,water dikinase
LPKALVEPTGWSDVIRNAPSCAIDSRPWSLRSSSIRKPRFPAIEEMEAARAQRFETATVGTVLRGAGGCSGVARGRARVVLDPADPRGLEPGDVLVAPLTDPAWTPLFLPAAAVLSTSER